MTPRYQRVYAGAEATFSCKVITNLIWSFNDGPLPENTKTGKFGDKKYYIRIENVQMENAGTYTCSGMYGSNIIKAVGELEVMGKSYKVF